jgi:hypothetical protein
MKFNSLRTISENFKRGAFCMNNSTLKRAAILAVVLCAFLVAGGCGPRVEGTYTSNSGTMILELRSGGKASFTMMGETNDCTYTVSGKNIHLTCGKNETDFRIMDDGSLSSSSPFIGATFGVLKKSK